MIEYNHKVFSCSSCEHYVLLIKYFINVQSVLICCHLRIAALMPSLNACVCEWTASSCRSTRACSSTKSVYVTFVSWYESFPQFSCCRKGEYVKWLTLCVCLFSYSCWHRGGERRLWPGNLSTVHWQTAGGKHFPWCSCQTDEWILTAFSGPVGFFIFLFQCYEIKHWNRFHI